MLYRMAAGQASAQCDGSSAISLPASTCVFNDVTSGNNAVPGESSYGGAAVTYPATVGYDLASGLGSVNAYNLVSSWGTSSPYAPTNTTLSIAPAALTTGASATVSVRVTPRNGSGTPTGTVSIKTSMGAALPILTLAAGSAVATVSNWPAGSYTVSAHYSGDANYAPSDSTAVAVSVAAAAAKASLSSGALAFGTVAIGSAQTQTVVLTNSGGASLTGIAVAVSGATAADFTVANGCGTTLAAGGGCTLTVTFRPTAAGARAATLTVTSSANTLSAALSGTGGAFATAAYTLQAPATATSGATMVVNWTAPAGHASNDFIGLYSTTAGYWFQTTGGATSGSFTVRVPAAPGSYFFRYVEGNVWKVVAQTPNITVK